MNENIKKNFIPEPWQPFRDQELWTINVNDILEANLDSLKRVYSTFFTAVKKFMDLKDVIELYMRIAPVGLSENDV